MKKKQYVVIGLGRFGASVAKTLYELGNEVLAVDKNEKIVQEIFEEDKPPKFLKKRITEIKRPVVVEREIETIENNDVVERRRESVQPDCKMELREVVKFKQVEQECASKNAVSPYQALAAEGVSETSKINVWNALGVLVILTQVLAIGYFWLF